MNPFNSPIELLTGITISPKAYAELELTILSSTYIVAAYYYIGEKELETGYRMSLKEVPYCVRFDRYMQKHEELNKYIDDYPKRKAAL